MKTKTKPKKSSLAAFLAAEAAITRECSICKRPGLAADIVEFLDNKAAGKIKTTFHRFYEKHVSAVYAPTPSRSTLRMHTIDCLKRDMHGKPL